VAAEVADLFIKLTLLSGPLKSELKAVGVEGESLINKMGGLGPAMTKVGGMVAAAGVGVAAVSVKLAGDWQQSMTKLVTSAGETGSIVHGRLVGPIADVSDQMLKMAVTTATSTKQLADAMYYVESAGYHGAQGINVLNVAAEGARAEGADVVTVANALTTALTAMGDTTGKTAVPVMNQIVAAVSLGKTSMQAFAGALHSVLPQAHAAGISLAEVLGAMSEMTRQGTSADQATQMLGHTISSLQTPNAIAIKWMNQMGVSSTDLQENLGSRGLTGTLEIVNQAILNHMGPDGKYLVQTFASSKDAAQGLQTMLQSMPAALKNLSTEVVSGTISTKDYSAAIKEMPPNLQAMGSQFLTNYKNASSFNLALRGGGTDVQTYAGLLRHMLGDQMDTNTALQIGGINLAAYTQNVKTISEASQHAGKDIENWGTITAGFNFKIEQLKQEVAATAIKIGSVLIPVLESGMSLLARHKKVVEGLAMVIGGVLLMALGMWVKSMTTALIKTVVEGSTQLAVFTAKILTTSAALMVSLLRGILETSVAFAGFVLKLVLGEEALDALKLRLAAAGIGMKTFTAETVASTTAAETAAGASGIGGLVGTLGRSLPVIGAVVVAGIGLGKWLNDLTGEASKAGPSVDQLTVALMDSSDACTALAGSGAEVTRLMSGLGLKVSADTEPMAQFGIVIGKLSQQMGGGASMTKNYDGALANLVASGNGDRAKSIMDQITAATDKNGKALINTAKDFPQYFAALDRQAAQQATAATSTQNATDALQGQDAALGQTTAAADDTASAIDGVTQAQQTMTAGLEMSGAMDNFQKQLKNVRQALIDNGSALTGNSDAALANRDALRQAAQGAVDVYNDNIKNGKMGIPAATQALKDQIQALVNTSSTSESTRKKVQAYIDTLGLIPPDIQTNLNVSVTGMTDIQKMLAASGVVVVGGNTVGHGKGQSRMASYDVGGYVPGPKGAPQLAIVHGGEFVLSNDMLAAASKGGGAGPMVSTASGGGAPVYVNNIYIAGSVLAERDLRNLMQTQMLQLGGRNSTSYTAYKR